VLNLVPGGPLPIDTLASSAEADLTAIERVPTRLVYSSGIARNEGNRRFLQRYEQAGAKVRIADELPHRLIICDRSCAVLPLSPSERGSGALVVREPGMVASLYALFSGIWSRAVPLARFDPEVSTDLEPGDRDVLLLMSSGVTDEVAAARLGVSVRTYRRTVAALLRRLGASSRFQAGVRAAERGWI
jgi:DNA-binding CsgD family transcriptional regulator